MGGGQKKTGKGRLDKFYHLAKEQGYRSRASFKLVQLNKKFDFLSGAKCCIDLCAAPGGWLQVASKYMPVSSLIIGIDLDPIRPIKNCITMMEDITTPSCRNSIRKHLKTWKADVVLHDGAPNVGKNWIHDAFTQSQLVLAALKLATEFLCEGGTFVTKVFRSQDYNALIYVMKKLFQNVQATKPKASRNTSAEIFVVCQKFLAPKTLDPKFLDPKYAFAQVDDESVSVPDVLNPKKKKKRKALGYATEKLLVGEAFSAKKFLESATPVQELAKFDRVSFDKDDVDEMKYLSDPLTTPEILACCQDLLVLNRRDFKNLLKWRTQLRKKYMAKEEKEKEDDEKEEVDQEEVIDDELQQSIKKVMGKEKKKKKKEARGRAKLRERAAMGMDAEFIADEADTQGLFSLSTMTSKKALEAVGDLDYYVSSGHEDSDMEGAEREDVDYDEFMESQLDEMYEVYRAKKGLDKKREAKTRNLLKASGFVADNDEEKIALARKGQYHSSAEEEEDEADSREKLRNGQVESDLEMESDEDIVEEGERNPLLVIPKEAPVKVSKRTALWFDQPLFKDMLDEGEEEEDEDEAPPATSLHKGPVANYYDGESSEDEQAEVEEGQEDEGGNDNGESSDDERPKKKRKTEPDFEIVPQANDWSDAEDLSDYDSDEIARALALGQAIVDESAGKVQWNKVIDDGYNRYSHNDQGNLPLWFMDDEKEHNKPQAPVTKEQVNEIKARFMDLNARPIKKIAEAKSRKKMKTMKRMEKLKEKANSIADNPDIADSAKMKELERLAKRQQMMGRRPKKQVVVRRGFQNGKGAGKGTKCVDRRMMKETRAKKRVEKAGKSKKRKR